MFKKLILIFILLISFNTYAQNNSDNLKNADIYISVGKYKEALNILKNLESFKKELFFKKYNNHFKNRIKNYNYCRKITNEIFYTFYKQLNKYHNTKFSSHYWKFITYTWLFLKVNL